MYLWIEYLRAIMVAHRWGIVGTLKKTNQEHVTKKFSNFIDNLYRLHVIFNFFCICQWEKLETRASEWWDSRPILKYVSFDESSFSSSTWTLYLYIP